MDIIYDTETFPNCFLLCAKEVDSGVKYSFEISDRIDQSEQLMNWLVALKETNARMVGFNNIAFDYPVLHGFIRGLRSAKLLHEKAVQIIESQDRFTHMVYPSDRFIPQVDLLKIHHFDNKARMTGLKALEFNMRLDNISDLPFPPNTVLMPAQMDVLKSYCFDDVEATEAFYYKSLLKIQFREHLSIKHQKDFLNHSDVKIGKEIFQISLEAEGVQCYDYSPETGRTPRQTPRESIKLAECIPGYVTKFSTPEFQNVLNKFRSTVITETKGAFDDFSATVRGVEYVFGTGGIHASVSNEHFKADDEWMIYDVDVTSLYPSLAIENGLYPEHLGKTFVDVYRKLRADRISHSKGTAENDMLKLALNGVYGASNDKFSIFYDPLFTMKVTVAGQLSLLMLIEGLLTVDSLRVIQANTDGITMIFKRNTQSEVDILCNGWEQLTKLSLERVKYSRMWIADVNSYIAEREDGKVKRKGRYEYELDWHKDASALVVPKVAEKVLLHGCGIMRTLTNWLDRMDFMMRAKANKGTRLVLDVFGSDYELDRTQRYYISEQGFHMFKIMPPLAKKPGVYRRIAVNSGYKVTHCNDMKDAIWPIDYRWYANEVSKLIDGVM